MAVDAPRPLGELTNIRPPPLDERRSPLEEDAPEPKVLRPHKEECRAAAVIGLWDGRDTPPPTAVEQKPRGRGRPRKPVSAAALMAGPIIKRARGRPRKIKRVPVVPEGEKRKRGRPRKQPSTTSRSSVPASAPSYSAVEHFYDFGPRFRVPSHKAWMAKLESGELEEEARLLAADNAAKGMWAVGGGRPEIIRETINGNRFETEIVRHIPFAAVEKYPLLDDYMRKQKDSILRPDGTTGPVYFCLPFTAADVVAAFLRQEETAETEIDFSHVLKRLRRKSDTPDALMEIMEFCFDYEIWSLWKMCVDELQTTREDVPSVAQWDIFGHVFQDRDDALSAVANASKNIKFEIKKYETPSP